jgi:putative DNA primase/helicase
MGAASTGLEARQERAEGVSQMTREPEGDDWWKRLDLDDIAAIQKQLEQEERATGANGQQAPSGLIMVRAADVKPVAVDWIWDGRIARGKITIIAGAPDVGKSQIGAFIAARITNGQHWPNGALAPLGDVVILASEDSIDDTWVPRLMAAGADLCRVHFIKMVIEHGKRRTFNLQSDLDALGKTLNALPKPQLVIIDPITSYLGKVDAHRTPDVRAVMEPVTAFAESCRVGIFAVTHPPKAQGTAMNSFTGSMAFVASARIAFFIVNEPGTERRLMLAVKNNVGIKAQGRGYTIAARIVADNISAPYIIWDDAPVDMTADQAIVAAGKHAKEGRRSLNDAIEFLKELLADGPVGAVDADEAATEEGISKRTLARAKKALKVTSIKGEFEGGWAWQL